MPKIMHKCLNNLFKAAGSRTKIVFTFFNSPLCAKCSLYLNINLKHFAGWLGPCAISRENLQMVDQDTEEQMLWNWIISWSSKIVYANWYSGKQYMCTCCWMSFETFQISEVSEWSLYGQIGFWMSARALSLSCFKLRPHLQRSQRFILEDTKFLCT